MFLNNHIVAEEIGIPFRVLSLVNKTNLQMASNRFLKMILLEYDIKTQVKKSRNDAVSAPNIMKVSQKKVIEKFTNACR